jgi:hypothetical protein
MVKLTYCQNIQPENLSEIKKYLEPFLWLVPDWCHEIVVSLWSADQNTQGGAAIRTGIKYEYRKADMDFYGAWLLETHEDKTLHVIHDLLHIPTSVYVDYAERTMNMLCPREANEQFHAHMMEESRIYCESMTQDLAKAIYDRFKGPFGVRPGAHSLEQ